MTLPLLVGCTTAVDAANLPDADSSELAAAISIETTSYADEITPAHTTAVARFIRARSSVEQGTLQMLGAALDLPPVGTCSGISPRAESGGQAVELVDVGAINIDVGGHSTFLAPRNLPDMDDLVWGVVYSARADGTEAPVSGSISLRASGSKNVGAFSIDVADLQAPTDVRFDGAATSPITISSSNDLHVTWTAATPPSNDIIYFEITSDARSGDENLICAEADVGFANLDAHLFSSGHGNLTVHRLHREAVTARGVDDGEASFDYGRVYEFSR
jgi:hypothetical protein